MWGGRGDQLCAAARTEPPRRERGERAREEGCQKDVHVLTVAESLPV